MKRSRKIAILTVLFLVLMAGAFVSSAIHWGSINTPEGKFTNVTEYIAHGRLPSRVTKVEKSGETYFIAFSPMDDGLALASEPAAYVFDESGTMVDWSADTGDDRDFKMQWLRPREETPWRLEGEDSSLEELQQLGTRPGPSKGG